jgi:DNA-binding beta-propeller fold protein YncE
MAQVDALEELHSGVDAFHLGYFGKAVQAFEDALRLSPDDVGIKNWLARTYFRMGLEDTALSMWKDIVRLGKGTPLLEYIIHVVEMRAGLGRELYTPDVFVVNYELDAGRPESRYFKRPTSVYSLPDGNYFVVAYGSNEVLSFNVNSFLNSKFRGGVESLDHPFDIIASGGNYFLSEFEGNVITKYDKNFVKLKSFGGKGIAEGKLLGPQYLAIDDDGYLYVTDWGNRRVAKYDVDGNFILSFGKDAAQYPFQKLEPTGIACNGGRIYVADQFSKQIVVFDTSGNYIGAYGEKVLKSPEGILFFDENTLLVADGPRIMGLDLDEEIWKVWSDVTAQGKRLVDLALTPNNDILAADFDANKIFMISEVTSLYSGFFVQIQRVDARNFPEVSVDISVEDIQGRPIVGLVPQNLFITEAGVPVRKTSVILANTEPNPLSAVILVEDSLSLDKYQKELKLCIENIMGVLGKNARIKIVFARTEAALEADFGKYDEKRIDELLAAEGKPGWKLDAGVKTAVAELSPERGRKAVIFLSSGILKDSAFSLYTLQEVSRNLRNNGVRFYPVYLGSLKKNSELEYITGETGGKSYTYFDPEGLKKLLQGIVGSKNSTYVVRYTSPSESEFGRKYIPLEAQVLLYKKSGKDESGYFAPIVNK